MKNVDAELVLKFCNQYVAYIESNWFSMIEEENTLINKAYQNVIISRKIGEDNEKFKNYTDKQILNYFREEKIKALEGICCEEANIFVKKELDKYLKKNRNYAKACEMIIPIKDSLTTRSYYYNYLLAKIKIMELSLLTSPKVSKR